MNGNDVTGGGGGKHGYPNGRGGQSKGAEVGENEGYGLMASNRLADPLGSLGRLKQ